MLCTLNLYSAVCQLHLNKTKSKTALVVQWYNSGQVLTVDGCITALMEEWLWREGPQQHRPAQRIYVCLHMWDWDGVGEKGVGRRLAGKEEEQHKTHEFLNLKT